MRSTENDAFILPEEVGLGAEFAGPDIDGPGHV